MDELPRFALGGNKVIPAARDVRVLIQAENAARDRVAVMVIVKQPAVETGLAERGLHCIELHREMIREW